MARAFCNEISNSLGRDIQADDAHCIEGLSCGESLLDVQV